MSRLRDDTIPHVVIVGGGFGGLETAMRLKRAPVKVTLLDRHNYHLFQPLLYQVATGGLSPANIAAPLRSIVSRQANCEVQLAEVVDFEPDKKTLILSDGHINYDVLVLAAGATHSYFGNDQWQAVAPGLKTLSDAAQIRRRVYGAFEAAERESDPATREAYMTFVVVGGGPTGVELAGALSEIARHTLKHDFRHIRPEHSRIIVVEAAPHVLAHYPEDLCQKAAEKIGRLGIEIHTKTKVTEITPTHVHFSGPDGDVVIATRTVLWGAGVKASPLGRLLAKATGVEADRGGRIPVAANLQIKGHDDIYVIGDIAANLDSDDKPLPGLASVAVQQGRYVARSIAATLRDKPLLVPFEYKDRGTMATIGRNAAVAEIGKYKFSGYFAWLLWLFVHLMLIVQFQNRLLILMQWSWSYITFNRSNRIITGESAGLLHTSGKVE